MGSLGQYIIQTNRVRTHTQGYTHMTHTYMYILCTFICIIDQTSDLNKGTSLIQFVVVLYINHRMKYHSYRTGMYTVFNKANASPSI